MMTETTVDAVDTRLADYITLHHAACDASAAAARQRAANNQASERARVAALASRPRARSRRVGAAWRSMPIASRPMVAWESMPLALRLELATIPQRYKLDVAASALIVLADHAEWPIARIVRRAKNLFRDELRGRYDAGVSRRAIGRHETTLTDRHARDLASSVALTVSGELDARAAVTAALVRSLPHGETILAGLMAGETQSDIGHGIGVDQATVCRWLSRVHDDASALLS